MSRVIPIVDRRGIAGDVQAGVEPARGDDGPVLDRLRRPLHDLRISVTDRCNFRCTYCMPKEVFDRDYRYLPHADLLSFEEIVRVARAFVGLGVEKIRLTGGEPLLRKDLERLVAMLAGIALPGRPGQRLDLTLTTNGSLLRKKAADLRAAGLERITVSLDALDDPLFRALNDVDYPVEQVLDGIAAAMEAGFGPVKVNMVVKRGVNDGQIEAMAAHFRGTGVILRFIEYMDVGASNGWTLDDVVPSAEVARRVGESAAIEPLEPNYPGEVAQRWRYLDGSGEVGFISSVTQAFCSSCTRARLAPDGRVYTCLFAGAGTDLRSLLRSDAGDIGLSAKIAQIWRNRSDRYSEIRSAATAGQRDHVEMSFIGG